MLSLNSPEQNPENRWTLPMCIDVHAAFDIIEKELGKDKAGTPAALYVNRKRLVEQINSYSFCIFVTTYVVSRYQKALSFFPMASIHFGSHLIRRLKTCCR